MGLKYVLAAAAAVALTSTAVQAAGCDPAFTQSHGAYSRVVDSLRPEKPGVLRVFAADGPEVMGGEALWMKGQVREIGRACARGDIQDASQRLQSLRLLIDSKAPR